MIHSPYIRKPASVQRVMGLVLLALMPGITAYALKGNDLRINKVDVVDVDLHRREVHGTTWFALFSPRVQNYTVGVEPAPGWGGRVRPCPAPPPRSRPRSRRSSSWRRPPATTSRRGLPPRPP